MLLSSHVLLLGTYKDIINKNRDYQSSGVSILYLPSLFLLSPSVSLCLYMAFCCIANSLCKRRHHQLLDNTQESSAAAAAAAAANSSSSSNSSGCCRCCPRAAAAAAAAVCSPDLLFE